MHLVAGKISDGGHSRGVSLASLRFRRHFVTTLTGVVLLSRFTTKPRRTVRPAQTTTLIHFTYAETCFDRCHKLAGMDNVTVEECVYAMKSQVIHVGWNHTLPGKPFPQRTP